VSAENVELVRRLYAATEGAGRTDLLEMLPEMIRQLCDPEVEMVETPERVDARTYRGHDGVLECWTRWLDQWDEYSFELERLEDHGEQVFAVAHERGSGRVSGAPADALLHQVWTIHDGKLLRYQEFYDESAARQALSDS
jgi:ketosteroid isomerase-like protein